MNRISLPSRTAMAVLLLVLGGCASGPGGPTLGDENWRPEPGARSAATVSDAAAQQLGDAPLHQHVSLPATNPLQAAAAEVRSEYLAASGKRCRRVAGIDVAVERVICRVGRGTQAGEWAWTRDLNNAVRTEVSEEWPLVLVPARHREAPVTATAIGSNGADVASPERRYPPGFEHQRAPLMSDHSRAYPPGFEHRRAPSVAPETEQ